jgi:hypothetical protein
VSNCRFNSKKNYSKIIFSNSGNVTLILLGFLGLFIVAGLIQLNRTHDTNLSASKSLRQNIEIDLVMDEAREYLRSKGSCSNSFKNKLINGETTGIALFGCDENTGICTADTRHIIVAGALIPVAQSIVKLESMKLKSPSSAWLALYRPSGIYDPNANMRTLFIEFKFVKQIQKDALSNVLGLADISRSIPIEVKVNPLGGLIESCYFDSNSDTNLWVRNTCVDIFGGTIFNSLCVDINLKGSVATDGHFCLNEVTADVNMPGNIKKKDCVKSWYFE